MTRFARGFIKGGHNVAFVVVGRGAEYVDFIDVFVVNRFRRLPNLAGRSVVRFSAIHFRHGAAVHSIIYRRCMRVRAAWRDGSRCCRRKQSWCGGCWFLWTQFGVWPRRCFRRRRQMSFRRFDDGLARGRWAVCCGKRRRFGSRPSGDLGRCRQCCVRQAVRHLPRLYDDHPRGRLQNVKPAMRRAVYQ